MMTETPYCSATEVMYQETMGKIFTFKTSVISVLSSKTLNVVKRKGDVTQILNECIFTKNSLSVWTLNILSLYCIQFNIARKGFANHCFLILFTFYTAIQLFWNRGCTLTYTCSLHSKSWSIGGTWTLSQRLSCC